jgi:hypothetical protein
MLGAALEEDEDPASDDASPAVYGDLEALVQEYLWERQVDADSSTARTLHLFVEHQNQLPVPGVFLEAIPARELVSFLLRTYLAATGSERAAQVRARFAALAEFYSWAQETQVYSLADALGECRQALIEPLDRLTRASVALSQGGADAAHRPRVVRVNRVDGGEVEVVGSDTEPSWIDAPEAAPDLRPDDVVLAALRPDGRGGLSVVGPAVVLPGAAADLLE